MDEVEEGGMGMDEWREREASVGLALLLTDEKTARRVAEGAGDLVVTAFGLSRMPE